jgi:hypothetical protein
MTGRRRILLAALVVAVLGAGLSVFLFQSPDDPKYPPLSRPMINAMAAQSVLFEPDPDETRARAEEADRLGDAVPEDALLPDSFIAVSFGTATGPWTRRVPRNEIWVVYINHAHSGFFALHEYTERVGDALAVYTANGKAVMGSEFPTSTALR